MECWGAKYNYVVSLFQKQRQGIRQDGGLIVKILLETIHGRGRYCPGYTNNILRPQTSSSACIVCDAESDPWLVLGLGPKLNLIMNRIYSYKLKAILLTFSGSETIMWISEQRNKSMAEWTKVHQHHEFRHSVFISFLPKKASGILFHRHFTTGAPNVRLGTKCLQWPIEH